MLQTFWFPEGNQQIKFANLDAFFLPLSAIYSNPVSQPRQQHTPAHQDLGAGTVLQKLTWPVLQLQARGCNFCQRDRIMVMNRNAWHSCKYICSFVCQSYYRQINIILFSTTNLDSLLRCISILKNLVCSYLKWAWNHRHNPVWCSTTHNDSCKFHFPSEYVYSGISTTCITNLSYISVHLQCANLTA